MAVIPTDGAVVSRWLANRHRPRHHFAEGRMSPRHSQFSRSYSLECFGDRRDVLWGVATTTAGDVNQATTCKIAEIAGHIRWLEIKSSRREWIRQPSIRVTRDRYVRFLREVTQERIHQIGAKRAVEPHRKRFHMGHRVPERFGCLRGDHGFAATPHRR